MELLNKIKHRPYPIPKGSWIMKQVWNDLLFAHWPVDIHEISPLIPKGIELDLYEGKPWISIVPFHMSGIRARGLPAIAFTDRFPELNVRTYVKVNGRSGVFFLSLDADHRLAVEAARAVFHLPYLKANMKVSREGESILYESKRSDKRGKSAIFKGSYQPISPIVFNAEPDTLIHWLTERYCLYTTNAKGTVLRGEIHHLPWGLQRASLETKQNNMAEAHGIHLPDLAPILSYTKRLDVLIWSLRKM